MLPRILFALLITSLAACTTSPIRSSRISPPENNIYAGVSLGQAKFDQSPQDFDSIVGGSFGGLFLVESSDLDDSDLSYGLVLGYRFAPYVATEIAYVNLGELTYNATGTSVLPSAGDSQINVKVGTDGVAASILGFLPIAEQWELYARGGLLFADTTMDFTQRLGVTPFGGSFSEDSEEFFGGIGASYRFGERLTFRLEYQRYFSVGDDVVGETDIDTIGLQVFYSIF